MVQTLTVYIESDGAPWRVPDEPPFDPTPHKPMVLQMAAIGEKSGELETMLLRVAESYEHQSDLRIAGLLALLRPSRLAGLAIIGVNAVAVAGWVTTRVSGSAALISRIARSVCTAASRRVWAWR